MIVPRRLHSFDGHRSAVFGLCRGPGEGQFFSASADKYVVLWNAHERRQEGFSAQLTAAAYTVHYLDSFELLVAGTGEGNIHVIDFRTKREIRNLAQHQGPIFCFSYDAVNKHLLVCGGDGNLSVWSLPEFELIRLIPLGNEKIRQASIDLGGKYVAIACGDGTVRILDLNFLNELHTIAAHEGGATSVVWHPEKPVLVSGGKDGFLRCWNATDNYRKVLSFAAHQAAIYSVFFSSEGLCLSASRDSSIKGWDARTFDPLFRMDKASGGHSHSVNCLLDLGGTEFISAGDDRKIILWEITRDSSSGAQREAG